MTNELDKDVIDKINNLENNMLQILGGLDLHEEGVSNKTAATLPEEGLYLNMSFDEYKALPYFSRSLAKKVRFDLEEAQHYLKNPTEETSAMALGTAIHSMFLEPEDFAKTYVKNLSFADFAGKTILKTNDDLKDFLAERGEKKTGNKDELIERARPHLDPEKFVIWEEELAAFEKKVAKEKKIILSKADFEVIKGLRDSFAKRKLIPQIIKNGYPEVTIIWKDKETGIMCKCRLDYLQPLAIADVKSFSVKSEDKSLFEYLFTQTTKNYYNFQFVIYREAIEEIIKKIRTGKAKIYGEVSEEWKKEFLENSQKQFFILYVRTAAPYQMKAIELERSGQEGGTSNEYFSVAATIWHNSIRKFAEAEKTGIWIEKEVETLGDEHVPSVIYQASIY